jgi:ribosomal protein L11 methyltransferase
VAIVVRVEVPTEDVEVAGDLLWQAGATAVGEATGTGADGAAPTVVLTAELPAVPAALAHHDRWSVSEHVDDGGWQDGWRPFARAVRAGPFLVRPPWVDATVPDDAIELVLDGGRAFGTGSHPSTVLALELLAPRVRRGDRVLDLGCGSGAVAVAAALLGAHHVRAVDVDAAAIEATTANALANGVGRIVEVVAADAATVDVDDPFDVVVANVGAPLVEDLAPAIRRLTAPGGVVVLSGMLAEREVTVPDHHPGFVLEATAELEGWTAVALRASAPSPAAPPASGPGPAAGA